METAVLSEAGEPTVPTEVTTVEAVTHVTNRTTATTRAGEETTAPLTPITTPSSRAATGEAPTGVVADVVNHTTTTTTAEVPAKNRIFGTRGANSGRGLYSFIKACKTFRSRKFNEFPT